MRETDDSDLRLDLERAAVMLTAKQRRALWLWCQGYTQEEIASALGVTQPSIWERISNALAALRAQTL